MQELRNCIWAISLNNNNDDNRGFKLYARNLNFIQRFIACAAQTLDGRMNNP